MPDRPQHPLQTDFDEQFENLRRGTFQKFVSDWVELVVAEGTTSASVDITHDLGEVPCVVDVILSTESDGASPIESSTDISFTKTATTITVSNASTDDSYYVQVRAF